MATLVKLRVVFEEDYFDALWYVDGHLLHAAEKVNIFNNSECGTTLSIVDASYVETIPSTYYYKRKLISAGIYTDLEEFNYED